MALLGGGVGGAGNPVGGSFTGPAEALEIIGDQGYAYSGAVGVGSGDVTMLSFTTGNYTFTGRVYTGYCAQTNITDDMSFAVYLNGGLISARYLDTSKESNVINMNYHTIVIPPYTEVRVACSNISSQTDRDMACIMTGEIIRG